MNIPFPHIENKVTYTKTFLAETSVKMFFAESSFTEEVAKRLFRDSFGIELSAENYKQLTLTKLKISDKDNGVYISFAKESIKIRVDQAHYSNFKLSMEPILTNLVKGLPSGFEFSGLKVKKINVWPVISPPDSKNIKSRDEWFVLKRSVLSSEFGEKNKISELESLAEFYNPPYGKVRLNSFLVIPDNEEMVGGIMLISNYNLFVDIKASGIISETERMNNVLYDAYHWAVSQNVIDSMK